ncbi:MULTISPECIES: 5-carboxymethyl-2-hydroxymuconate Delta-isomerase [Polaribacter]|uniref:5-carboxymethyl-2-hydroxymuconate Delta-isomerase n=1 Tax=Polaribacter marinaquae TaxID=1642819 RepID=A0ABZ2TUH4_9FLAO|nr:MULTISPECIES: 5-carboxymethyl-2-hydroxymuconate Delta-isomerase [unclassified Polaribacter]AQS92598.1 5-carboxymethyl-2-hydroxymuconate isomerase [Polaribacter sp. BM10]SHN02105.1 5-carboxymethyl-2-hydroxymuconate isomerase [Polaribacter sp. KT 15]
MPHFILDCSENILKLQEPRKVLEAVFETAFSTGLFDRDDIKVRLNPFKHSLVQSAEADFIHVFGNIMEGRTEEQKSDLSYAIVATLTTLFPNVPIISMNIRNFEQATYCNKSMI